MQASKSIALCAAALLLAASAAYAQELPTFRL